MRTAQVFSGDRRFHRGGVPERHEGEAPGEGPEAVAVGFVRREAHDGGGAPVEVVVGHDDLGAVPGDVLGPVAPAPGRLDGGLHRLRPRIHGQGHVEAGDLHQALQEGSEKLRVVGPAGDREPGGLLHHGVEDARMAMAQADRRIGAHHVEVAPSLGIRRPDPFGLREDDRQGIVVGGGDGFLESDAIHGILQRQA
jgi:hypothetical protein